MAHRSYRIYAMRTPSRLLLPTLLAIVTLAPLGSAYAQSRDVKLSGMGTRKCSEWQQWKEGSNGEARATALEWAQGFIAAHNIYARSGTEPASSVVADTKVLVPLLDAYCQKNPESRLFLGVIGITQSLGGAKINLTPKTPASPSAPMPSTPAPLKKGERES
jgi:hypothetical protein